MPEVIFLDEYRTEGETDYLLDDYDPDEVICIED